MNNLFFKYHSTAGRVTLAGLMDALNASIAAAATAAQRAYNFSSKNDIATLDNELTVSILLHVLYSNVQ